MTSTERSRKFRLEAKRKNWKRRDYYATEPEHERLRALLNKLRGEK